ncbi:10567_t:CDS:2, partial [Diversispora eburnea]
PQINQNEKSIFTYSPHYLLYQFAFASQFSYECSPNSATCTDGSCCSDSRVSIVAKMVAIVVMTAYGKKCCGNDTCYEKENTCCGTLCCAPGDICMGPGRCCKPSESC